MSLRGLLKRCYMVAALAGFMLFAACGGTAKHASPTPQSGSLAGLVTPIGTGTPFAQRIATPTATPTETPDDSPLTRLVIPKISVSAKLVTLGIIPATNAMDSPKNKDDVGYYDFTPRPSYGGNTVLSGHVDWYTGQTGVFWDLKKLQAGDEVDLNLQDGKVFRYKVTDIQLYDNDTAPIDEILGDTSTESVTLVTCEGTFNPAAAEYNKRRVVRAEREYTS